MTNGVHFLNDTMPSGLRVFSTVMATIIGTVPSPNAYIMRAASPVRGTVTAAAKAI
jgi:hypothetical protein